MLVQADNNRIEAEVNRFQGMAHPKTEEVKENAPLLERGQIQAAYQNNRPIFGDQIKSR